MKTTKHPSEISLTKETFNQVQELIQDWLSKKDYKVTGNILELSELLDTETLRQQHSGNKKKQFKKRIFRFSKTQTITQLTNLLNEFNINSIKIDLSDKEAQIIRKKIEMKELKARYEKSMSEYKLEKGDYFKNKA